MSLAQICKTVLEHVANALWALGGIGAAADIGPGLLELDDFGPAALGFGRGEACPVPAGCQAGTLETEPCRNPGRNS